MMAVQCAPVVQREDLLRWRRDVNSSKVHASFSVSSSAVLDIA